MLYIFKRALKTSLDRTSRAQRAVEIGVGYGYFKNSTYVNKVLTKLPILSHFNSTALTLTMCGLVMVYAVMILVKSGGQSLSAMIRYIVANGNVWKQFWYDSPRTTVHNYEKSRMSSEEAKEFIKLNRRVKKKPKSAKQARKRGRKMPETLPNMVERDGKKVRMMQRIRRRMGQRSSLEKRIEARRKK